MSTGLRASAWTQARPAKPAPTTTTRSLSGPAIGVSFDHVSRPAGSGGGPGTAGKGREGEGRAGAAPPGGPSCRPMTADLAPTTPEARVAPSSRSEEHTSELQSLMRISYAVFCLKKKRQKN